MIAAPKPADFDLRIEDQARFDRGEPFKQVPDLDRMVAMHHPYVSEVASASATDLGDCLSVEAEW